MSAVPVVLLVCAAVWSTIAALNQVYVSPDNGHSCPSESTCHNLSYYISQLQTYFTSNTIIIFMNGEHQLDRQEPVMVVGADNLTLEGQGEWIAGPEENVMLSTAVINCTSGKGGFTFIDSSSITVRGLTFLTCGTVSYGDIDIGEPISLTPYAAVFAMNVSLFLFHQNSIQDIIDGFGLLVYQCDVVKVRNCSFYHSPWPHVQLDDMEFPEYDRGTTGFIWYSFANSVRLEFSNSNFTKCLINSFDYHGHVFLSYSQSKQLLQADFSLIKILQFSQIKNCSMEFVHSFVQGFLLIIGVHHYKLPIPFLHKVK